MSTPGLLMAFTKRGPTTTPEDWEEWYNTEHVPVLQSCPGWLTFARYNVLTPGCPPYVAIYDLETAQAARDAQKWVPNRPHVPQRELRCLADATSYDDHIYEFDEDPSAWTAGGPGKGVVLEWAAPGFEEQYATKVKALEEVDGFIRARRFKLSSFADYRNPNAAKPPLYLIIQEFESEVAAAAAPSVLGNDRVEGQFQRRELGLRRWF